MNRQQEHPERSKHGRSGLQRILAVSYQAVMHTHDIIVLNSVQCLEGSGTYVNRVLQKCIAFRWGESARHMRTGDTT